MSGTTENASSIVTIEMLREIFDAMKKSHVQHVKMSNMEINLSPTAFLDHGLIDYPLPGNVPEQPSDLY